MHDIRAIRDNPAAFDQALARRGLPAMSSELLAIDEERRKRIHAAETAKAKQNAFAKEVGAAKARGDEAEFIRLRLQADANEAGAGALASLADDDLGRLHDRLSEIPNLPLDEVPPDECRWE